MIALLIASLVRFPYTKDTYNNPQNLWIFAYVISDSEELLAYILLQGEPAFRLS